MTLSRQKGLFALLTLLVILSVFVGMSAHANNDTNTLVVNEAFKTQRINDFASITESRRSATYFDVLNGVARSPENTDAQNNDNRIWLSTTIENSGYSTVPLVINIDRLNVDDLQLYLLDTSSRIIKSYRYQAGKGDFSLAKPLPTIRLSFPLKAEEQVRLLVGVEDDGLKHFPISLWHQATLAQYDRSMLALLGVVFGVLSILAGYFLLSYLYQRTPARFWLSITNGVLFAVFFLAQGGLSTWPALTNYSEASFAVLLGLTFLSLGKVTHNLFPHVPIVLRSITFLLPVAMMAVALSGSAFHTVKMLFLFSAIIGLYHILLAFVFRRKASLGLSRIFIVAWLSFFCVYAIFTQILFANLVYTELVVSALIIMLTLGLLCLGFSVELKERSHNKQQLSEREATISNLSHFYDLFRNSAEGLYTSTVEGQLKTVNTAMCAVFGYDNEEAMLDGVTNTTEFYDNTDDRAALLGILLSEGQVIGREIKGKRSNGESFWFAISCQVRGEGDDRFLYGSIIDITERKQSNLSLEYMATHDSLSGVYNRRFFETTLKNRLAERAPIPVIILYLDLDRFKIINDTCGHKAGDALIKEISQLLDKSLPDNATLARLGGDEFGVILERCNEEHAYRHAVNILNAVRDFRFMWENRIFNLGVSIGLAICDDPALTPDQYLSMADAACYFAKEQGRNQVHCYSKDNAGMQRYQYELDWVTTINQALEEERFLLYYQPLRPLSRQNDGHYYEILLRLQQNDGSIVEPTAFLPTAERFEMNVKIDKWVISSTFAYLNANPEHLAQLRKCSINLNCHSLADRDFKLYVLNAFEKYRIPFEKICFEVIESVAIIKMDDTVDFMRAFNELGCTFALDDFGSGFSSYSYLKSLPVSQVKIDGSFIKDMLIDPIDAAMVASIKEVAKAMGMLTVGEFVENEATMVELGKMGIDFAQGFGVKPPAPLKEFVPL
ncbi:EAL domain-containing protein [Alteromonas sp. A079]|uniref:EAL domain-containing protein n=1 Tax=Alteromonas sp. A079 TaxID=3410268 RepID=UPI003BA02888